MVFAPLATDSDAACSLELVTLTLTLSPGESTHSNGDVYAGCKLVNALDFHAANCRYGLAKCAEYNRFREGKFGAPGPIKRVEHFQNLPLKRPGSPRGPSA